MSDLERLLDLLQREGLSPSEAITMLRDHGVRDTGFARVDTARGLLGVFPEIVLAEGKTPGQVLAIGRELLSRTGSAVFSRVDAECAEALEGKFSSGSYHAQARMFTVGDGSDGVELSGTVALVSAGTSDLHAAEETGVLLSHLGVSVERLYDVGVSGLHRLQGVLDRLRDATVAVVFAGMDAALPSVVGGLFPGPVIAVPTSTGYGTAFGGVTALLSALNSCSPGVAVLNIDNGVGAAAAAVRILNRNEGDS